MIFNLLICYFFFQSALASFYDDGTDDEPLSNNPVQASSRPAATAANRDRPMASVSSYKPAAKPKKWQPQSRYT